MALGSSVSAWKAEKTSVDSADPQTLASILAKQAAACPQDAVARIQELMATPAIQAVLAAAGSMAQSEGINSCEALEQITHNLVELRQLWSHVLCHEGLERLKELL